MIRSVPTGARHRGLSRGLFVLAAVGLAAAACGGGGRPGELFAGRPAAGVAGDNASHPAEPAAEPATFHSLGVRWAVRGDANAGVPLPNFNDGFSGKAPDLGCCELGAPLPHYGPRP